MHYDNYLKNQRNEVNTFVFPNLKLLHKNHRYSIKDGLYNLFNIIVIIHNKLVMELMFIMNLVQYTHNFGK